MLYKLKISNYNEVFVENKLFNDSQVLAKSYSSYLLNATKEEILQFLKFYNDKFPETFNPLDYIIKLVCCTTDDIVDYVNDSLKLGSYFAVTNIHYTDDTKKNVESFTVNWELMEFNTHTYKIPKNGIKIGPLTSLYGLFTILNKLCDVDGNVICAFDKYSGDLSSWDVSYITDMSYLFCGSSFFGNISNWNTSNVTNMEGMFSMNLINPNTEDETENYQPYYCGADLYTYPPYIHCSKYRRVKTVDRPSTYPVTDESPIYSPTNRPSTYPATASVIDISKWDTSKVTNMRGMFADSYFYKDLSNWNTSNVTDMSYMFSYLGTLNEHGVNARLIKDLSDWNTSNVTNMAFMFTDSHFNSDVSRWDVSKVTDMSCMFKHTRFVGDVSNWDVSNIVSCYDMFRKATGDHGSSPVKRVLNNWNLLDIESPLTTKENIQKIVKNNDNVLALNLLEKEDSAYNAEFPMVGTTNDIRDFMNGESTLTEDDVKSKMVANLTQIGTQYKYFGDTPTSVVDGTTFAFSGSCEITHIDADSTTTSVTHHQEPHIYGRCKVIQYAVFNNSNNTDQLTQIPITLFQVIQCSNKDLIGAYLCNSAAFKESNSYILEKYSSSMRFNYRELAIIKQRDLNASLTDMNKKWMECFYQDGSTEVALMTCIQKYYALIGTAYVMLHLDTPTNYEYCKKLSNLEQAPYEDLPRYYKYTIYDDLDNEVTHGTCKIQYYTNAFGQTTVNTVAAVLLRSDENFDAAANYYIANKTLFLSNTSAECYIYKNLKYKVRDEFDTPVTISFGDEVMEPAYCFATGTKYNYTITNNSTAITGSCQITGPGCCPSYTGINILTSSDSTYVNKALQLASVVNNTNSYALYAFVDNAWKSYGSISLVADGDASSDHTLYETYVDEIKS